MRRAAIASAQILQNSISISSIIVGFLIQIESLLLLSGVLLVSGCSEGVQPATVLVLVPPPPPPPPGFGLFDLKARGEAGGRYGSEAYGALPTGVIVPGGGAPSSLSTGLNSRPARPEPLDAGRGAPASGEAYQLNFEGADIATVSKAIFGDILQIDFIVDPRVTGQISLTSSHPVPRGRLIGLFESALLGVNAALIKEDGHYRIAPATELGGLRKADYRSAGDGFGVTVIVAKNIQAPTIGRLLENYGSRPATVKVEPEANLVIVQGTAAERRAALDAASMVDVDWMRSRSVAILPLGNSSPATIIAEVNRILGTGEGGLSQDIVQMQPITRLNAVLAVSRNRLAIEKVARWVSRLDKADYGALGVKVYKLQYAQAKAVAATLNTIFGSGGSSGSSSGQDDKDLLEPGGQSSASASAAGGGSASAGAAGGGAIGGGAANASSGFINMSGGSGGGAGGQASPSPYGALKTAATDRSGASADSSSAQQSGNASGSGSGRIKITPDATTNTLFISASRLEYRLIERAIRALDSPPVQVNIEATIAEVTLTDELQYGVQAYLNSAKGAAQLLNGASTGTGIPLVTTNPALNLLVGAVSNPRFLISALSSLTKTKILSSPSLVVLGRQSAVLQIDDQVPILTKTAVSVDNPSAPVVNNVDYKDTGIVLNIMPHVNANGVVTLDVDQQISAVTSPTTTTPNLTPTISQRRVRSQIAVANGQTVLLAGLISDDRTNTRAGIPSVMDINFLDELLSTRDAQGKKTELIIFIKPQVIRNAVDAELVSEEFRDRLLSMRPTLAPNP